MNFLAYTISFFWLGTMWVNMHRSWDGVKQINNKLVWISILLLFFASFFPYVTSVVASDFYNSVGQAVYGIVVLLVTFTNVWMYDELAKVPIHHDGDQKVIISHNDKVMALDIIIKVIGLLLTLTLLPSAMMWSVFITALVLIIPRSIKD